MMELPLLGRRAEVATTDAAITAAIAGERRLIIIRGPAGSGRKALLDGIAERAEAAGLRTTLVDAYPAAQSEIGFIAERLHLDGAPEAGLVHDAQWADPTSMGLLQRRMADDEGVLIVLAYGDTSAPQTLPLRRLVDVAERRGKVDELELGPLTTSDLTAIADQATAERVISLTDGIYRDVEGLLEDWVADGSIRIGDRRIEVSGQLPQTWSGAGTTDPSALDRPQRKLAEAVALAKRPVSPAVAAVLLGLSEEDALDVGERLSDLGLVAESRDGFTPGGDLVGARITESIGEVRTSRTYRELGDAFTAAGLADQLPGPVGLYYLEAGAAEEAIPLLDAAATAAIERDALAEAVPYLDGALAALAATGASDPALEGRLLLARARYYRIGGWSDLAADDLRRAIALLDGTARVDALGFLAAVEDDRQDVQTAEVVVAAALAEAEALDATAKLGSLLVFQARVLNRLGFPAETDASLDKGGAILRQEGSPFQRHLAAFNTARVDFDRGEVAKAAPVFERLVGDTEDHTSKAEYLSWLARAQLRGTRPHEGRVSVDEAIRLGDETGTSGPVFQGYMALAEGGIAYGRYAEALEAADGMLGYVLQQLPAWENAARYLRAKCMLGLGRIDDAAAEIAAAILLCPPGINGWRWRLRCEAVQLAVAAEQEAVWPKERAEDLTDELLQFRWFDVASELMAVRAAEEDDEDLARQGAALALRIGTPTVAAQAVEAGDLWSGPAAAEVGRQVKDVAAHVPDEWLETWAARPEIAAAVATPDLSDDEYTAVAAALEGGLNEALVEAGLADPYEVLSPAQRRDLGLIRRRPSRVARVAVGAVIALLVLIIVVGAAAVFAATRPSLEEKELALPSADQPFTETWPGFGAGNARTGASLATGVREPAGFYWRFGGGGAPFSASPIVLGQKVVVGNPDRNIYMIDRRAGDSVVRTVETGGPVTVTGAGAVLGGERGNTQLMVYVPSEDGRLYAVDAKAGRLRWSYPLQSSVSPVVDESAGLVYVGLDDGRIVALVAARHEETDGFFWATEPGTPVTTDLTLSGGKIYYGARNELHMVDVGSRSNVSCKAPAEGDFRTPVVVDPYVFAANEDGVVHVLETGTCKWLGNWQVQEVVTVKPAVVAGVIYQPTENGINAMSVSDILDPPDCAEPPCVGPLWAWPGVEDERFPLSTQSSPSVAGGLVYFGSNDGNLYALDVLSGELVWEWSEGRNIAASPAITDGVVYVASFDGTVVAIGSSPEEWEESRALAAESEPPPPTTTTTEPPTTTTSATTDAGAASSSETTTTTKPPPPPPSGDKKASGGGAGGKSA